MNKLLSYRRLGDFIERCEGRNSKWKFSFSDMRGVNNEGKICNSIAKTDGLDLSAYKIARKGDFIYNPARLDLGSISRLKENECIVSTLYVVFRVRHEKESQLLPEYLEMWIHRSEFHRYVSYVNWGSAREYFWYDDMCEVNLPVPDIDTQRRIVTEYQTVEGRIVNNEQFIQKLEETAHTIYKKVFVDDIDSENLPNGWRVGTLRDVAECFDSKRKPMSGDVRQGMEKKYPYYGAAALMDYVDNYIFDGEYVLMGEDGSVQNEDGTPVLQFVRGKIWVNNHAHVLQGKNGFDNNLLWLKLSSTVITDIVTGGVQAKINQENMFSIPVLIPSDDALKDIKKQINPLFSYWFLLKKENQLLEEMKETLLAKLA